MKISKTIMPTDSILSNTEYHYTDSYQGTFEDQNHEVTTTDIGKAFFTSAPRWTASLFALRNRIVSIFGLKTPGKHQNRAELLENFQCEKNERLGLFKVFNKSEKEVIIGEDDKHLNFRVSLLMQKSENPSQKTLTITTTVVFHNRFGRLYFLPVRPFHSLIVPGMLKRILKQIEERRG